MAPGRIISLRGDDHRDVYEVLPWYATGRLEPDEQARVETHLGQCSQCQAELRFQRRLNEEVGRLPIDVELGWAQMSRRLERDAGKGGAVAALSRLLDSAPLRSPWLGWAAAAAALLALGVDLLAPPLQPARYHALGAGSANRAGNVLVMFKPDSREAALRQALAASDARLVDGPTAAGAYLVHVPAAERAAALTRLRADLAVATAQPVDAPP